MSRSAPRLAFAALLVAAGSWLAWTLAYALLNRTGHGPGFWVALLIIGLLSGALIWRGVRQTVGVFPERATPRRLLWIPLASVTAVVAITSIALLESGIAAFGAAFAAWGACVGGLARAAGQARRSGRN
jgi:hypothetical protein